jgi:uncharacterized protein (DUF58 family)
VKPPPSELRPAPARQGPGPMPAALLDALDFELGRRAGGLLPGEQRAPGAGLGTELAQLRPYEVGDDVRQLDPAASARTRVPHVRLQVPERAITTWLLLDVSPSMSFGTAERLKSDVAEGVALAIGRLALRRAGRLAVISFGVGAPVLVPPRGGRLAYVGLRRTVAAGVAPDGSGDPSSLATALHRLARAARMPGLAVVVSDFRDQDDWSRPLRLVGHRHDVLAVEVGDPREAALPAVGHLTLVDPESGRHVAVDTSRETIRSRYAEAEHARREAVARDLRGAGARHVRLSTDEPWLRGLARALDR